MRALVKHAGMLVARSNILMSLLASASPQAAKDAGLRYVTCSEPGIRRVKRGKGFVYRLPNGKLLRHAAELERIRKLALPPAWTDVWICRDPRGHLLATGFDAKGRKQYRYHPRWSSVRDEAKYEDLLELARRLPRLRRRLAHDLALPQLGRDKVLATVVTVMASTALRVGNDRYASENGSFGLTTLLDRHAQIKSHQVEFSFKGKGGKPYRVSVRDRRLAAIVKRCRDIPGQRLFQYQDETGANQPVSSSDVNEYLKRVSGMELTAKTFRTWSATLLAASELRALAPAKSDAELKRHVNAVLALVARHLGNTPTVCRKSYVDPRVLDAYASATLQRCARRATRTSGLTRQECELVAILSGARQPERKAA
jgi:DNA topoisomerase I